MVHTHPGILQTKCWAIELGCSMAAFPEHETCNLGCSRQLIAKIHVHSVPHSQEEQQFRTTTVGQRREEALKRAELRAVEQQKAAREAARLAEIAQRC